MLKNIIKKYHYSVVQFCRKSITTLLARTYRRRTFMNNITKLRTQSLLNYSTLPYPTPWQSIKKNRNLRVEIGTGHGENLIKTGQDYPHDLIIGTEIASRFARMTAKKASKLPCANVKVIYADGYQVLKNLFSNSSIEQINILFPDPWHKKRHHKRRPLTAEFFTWAVKKLVKQKSNIQLNVAGTDIPSLNTQTRSVVSPRIKKYLQPYIFIATDWTEYYEFIIAELQKITQIVSYTTGKDYKPADWGMAETHYYKKWRKQGRTFYWIKVTQ